MPSELRSRSRMCDIFFFAFCRRMIVGYYGYQSSILSGTREKVALYVPFTFSPPTLSMCIYESPCHSSVIFFPCLTKSFQVQQCVCLKHTKQKDSPRSFLQTLIYLQPLLSSPFYSRKCPQHTDKHFPFCVICYSPFLSISVPLSPCFRFSLRL